MNFANGRLLLTCSSKLGANAPGWCLRGCQSDARAKIACNIPILESNVPLLASSSIDTDSEDHESKDGQDLDHTEVELDFAVEIYW
jgi:hypothetical protein